MPTQSTLPLTIHLTEPEFNLVTQRAAARESARLSAESAMSVFQRESQAYQDVIVCLGLSHSIPQGTEFAKVEAKAETNARGKKVYTLTLHAVTEMQPLTLLPTHAITPISKEHQTS